MALALLARCRVVALVFLVIGLFCALASRVILVIAAVNVSTWWTFVVWLPFGPLLFRLQYPDLARSSMLFRFATLPCLVLYLALGPGPAYRDYFRQKKAATDGYALEAHRSKDKRTKSSGPTVDVGADLEQRWVTNYREFQRLNAWSEALELRKRDLLRSDLEGNRAYEVELAQYHAALVKAKAEREALAAAAK